MTYGTRTDHYPATSLEARYEVALEKNAMTVWETRPNNPSAHTVRNTVKLFRLAAIAIAIGWQLIPSEVPSISSLAAIAPDNS